MPHDLNVMAPGVLPPPELRERVSGTRDEAWFVESGARTVNEWRRALEGAGMKLADFASVLDFGCGCGRALAHLAKGRAPGQVITGMDTDQQAIAWLSANMRDVTVKVLAELPPSPLNDSSMNLVLCHSVFTHLPEDVQFLWLEDIRRILKPGGVLVASFHGQKAVNGYLASLAGIVSADGIDSIRETIEARGFYHVAGRTESESSYPQYYGAAFHTVSYIAREWLKYFDLVAWHPTYALDHQDVLVLRVKKSV